MNSRLTQFLVLFGALLAFLPILGVDYLMDNYVRSRETARIQVSVDAITNEIQYSVYDSISILRKILNDSPSLCTSTFITNTRRQLQNSFALTQVLVENGDGVQYCDGFESTVRYSVLSPSVAIPGQIETLSIVQIEGQKFPKLKVSRNVSNNRIVSGFVRITQRVVRGMPPELASANLLRIALTDGSEILSIGEGSSVEENSTDRAYIAAASIADALPLVAAVEVPFATVRAHYADLDFSVTILVAVISFICLFFAIKYVREASLPALDLERAIASGEFKPHYQPIMNLSTGELTGCEVLIRWEKKDGEIVSPGMFIDYAEATGLAIPMTIRMMQQVVADLGELCIDFPTLKIGINLFNGHFNDTSFIEDVEAIFGDSAINYRQLIFEITERHPLEDEQMANTIIGGLHALGCRMAMDDVGTGHSNLSYMQTLGIDIVKIDRMFIDLIHPDTESLPILDGLISMASNMGTVIVAEGVETEAQALYLRSRGVYEAQGFLFAPALKPDAFITLARALSRSPNKPIGEDTPNSEAA